jgi:vancomycin resistance protein YoaR
MNLRTLKLLPFVITSLILFVNIFLNLKYKDRILPNTYITGIYVGGLTTNEALEKIKILAPVNKSITLTTQNKDYLFNSNYFKFEYDMENSVKLAYQLGRSKNEFENILVKFKSLVKPNNFNFEYTYDNSLVDVEVSRIVGEEKISGNDAEFVINNGAIDIKKEKSGYSVDYDRLSKLLNTELSSDKDSFIKIPFKKREPEILYTDLASIKDDVSSKFYKSFTLNFFEKRKYLTPKEVFSLIKIRKNKDGIYYDLNEELLKKLTFEIREVVDNKPRARVTKFEGDKVLAFEINQEGSVLDEANFRKDIRRKLFSEENSMDLPSVKIGNNFPKESYGINQLIGVGKSTYFNSINSRVHNLALAAEKINGTLVAPGEEFSFLQTVGPISSSTGFQTAYIISEGRTVLGEGGGVCQTSTTLFRAALNSGLPITSRYPHAYRVSYYEQDAKVGFDASVYYPSLDFKFRNDTGHYVLIQTEVDRKNYAMSFYLFGTKDGREVEVTDPKLYGFIPTPAPEYIEDKSLKPGEIKQIDFPASGITSEYERIVTRDGTQLSKDAYKSTYSPWKAIYLKGPSKK